MTKVFVEQPLALPGSANYLLRSSSLAQETLNFLLSCVLVTSCPLTSSPPSPTPLHLSRPPSLPPCLSSPSLRPSPLSSFSFLFLPPSRLQSQTWCFVKCLSSAKVEDAPPIKICLTKTNVTFWYYIRNITYY